MTWLVGYILQENPVLFSILELGPTGTTVIRPQLPLSFWPSRLPPKSWAPPSAPFGWHRSSAVGSAELQPARLGSRWLWCKVLQQIKVSEVPKFVQNQLENVYRYFSWNVETKHGPNLRQFWIWPIPHSPTAPSGPCGILVLQVTHERFTQALKEVTTSSNFWKVCSSPSSFCSCRLFRFFSHSRRK